ncbi:uncharacterized protein LOC144119687 [Amblyomma americanum]
MAKRLRSPSTTSDDSGELGDTSVFGTSAFGTSAFGVFDGDSSVISLCLDDTDVNIGSESVPMTTTTMGAASSSGDEEGTRVGRRSSSFSWPCTGNQTLVALAAVFQGLLILVTLTAINKYGIFTGPGSIDSDVEPAKYYEKPDILQPERNLAEDYSGSFEQERRSLKPTTPLDSAVGLSVATKLGAASDALHAGEDASRNIPSPDNSSRALLCLFADSYEGDFPAHLCTHLVFMNAVIDLQAQIIRPNSAEQGRAVLQRFINQRRDQEEGGSHFLVSLWEARVSDTYRDLFLDWSRGTRAATLALGWLQRTGLDGLAMLNLALTSDSAPDLFNIFKVLRAVMGRDIILVFGFYLPESYQGKEEKRVVRTLHQIANQVNLTVFEMHDPRPLSCKVFVPNAYNKRSDDADTPDSTILQSLQWSAGPAELYQRMPGRLCVSFTLAAFRFIVHVAPGHLGARCYNYYPASLRQHCRDRRQVHYAEEAIGNYAEVPAGTQLQSVRLEAFDTVTTLRKKITSPPSTNPTNQKLYLNPHRQTPN